MIYSLALETLVTAHLPYGAILTKCEWARAAIVRRAAIHAHEGAAHIALHQAEIPQAFAHVLQPTLKILHVEASSQKTALATTSTWLRGHRI